jgi:hypothetical protein
MPNSWAISSRANRLASSTMTVRTPLPSIRSKRAAKRPCLDRVRTGYRRIIELIDDAVASSLGEALDGVALAFLAVLVRHSLRTRHIIECLTSKCPLRDVRAARSHPSGAELEKHVPKVTSKSRCTMPFRRRSKLSQIKKTAVPCRMGVCWPCLQGNALECPRKVGHILTWYRCRCGRQGSPSNLVEHFVGEE